MENRLFLLQEPGVPTGLTQNILSGVDVTPEKEYSGKITLSQLNAYSGELKAEALTNFQTIKIEKDGSETYTNVAKLLIELQQGGGADDAREEADILIDSKRGDAELRLRIADVSYEMAAFHNVYSPVILDGYELVDAIETEIKFWAPSQEADGVRTKFVPRDGISRSEDMIAVLNGVIVTPEDGSFIMSQNGPFSIGFEFDVAPSVGDVVEFFANRVLGKASGDYENAKSANDAAEATAINDFNEFETARNAEIAGFDAEIASLTEKLSVVEADLKNARAQAEEAYNAYLAATSVAEINETSRTLIKLEAEASEIEGVRNEVSHNLDIVTDKKTAASGSLSSETAKRAEAAQAYDIKQAELAASIAMFAAIIEEHGAIENPPLA